MPQRKAAVWQWRRAAGWAGLLLLAVLLARLPLPVAAALTAAAAGGVLALRWPWLVWLLLAVLVPI